MIWTYTHLLAFALGGLFFTGAALAIAYYWDWRVSARKHRLSDEERRDRGLADYLDGARVRCPIDGDLERVTGYHSEGGTVIIEAESTGVKTLTELTTAD